MDWSLLKAVAKRAPTPQPMREDAYPCTFAELEAIDAIARDALLREGWIVCDEGEGDWSAEPPAVWAPDLRPPPTPMPSGGIDCSQ